VSAENRFTEMRKERRKKKKIKKKKLVDNRIDVKVFSLKKQYAFA